MELQSRLHYVGVVDWSVRTVSGHATPRGITHNAYLISDKYTAIVDTVPLEFLDEHIRKIQRITALD